MSTDTTEVTWDDATKEKVKRLVLACSSVANTKEYQRIHVCLFDPQAAPGKAQINTLKGEFEQSVAAVAALFGWSFKEREEGTKKAAPKKVRK